jgi:hypothetical protein
MSETPRGRPPKTKSVLYKIREETNKEKTQDIQVPDEVPVPSQRLEQAPSQSLEVVRNERNEKSLEPIEKKPRTEKQINAFQKMMDARKQKITIRTLEPEVVRNEEVKSIKEVVRNDRNEKQEPDMMKMMNELHERLNKMQNPVKEKKQKAVKEKKLPVVLEKPKPKKRVMKEETSEDEEEEEEEEESEDEDDAYVKKYTQKAEKRFNAVKQIEQRLQQVHKPKGKYDHLSIF